MNTRTIATILLGTCLVFSQKNYLKAQNDSPPVIKLKELYSSDEELRRTVEAMFENLQDLPDGSANPWRNKDIDDLYEFVNEWFYFLPNAHNALERAIEFEMLCYRNPAGMRFVLEEPGRSWTLYFAEERGKYMDSPASAKAIQEWLADPSLNNEDFVLPDHGFKSFNEFFTRELKPGARPVDAVTDNSILVSPADGIINMINNDLKLNIPIPAKGRMTLSLAALLDTSEYCEKFIGGTALAVVLMPHDCHHYHAPISGTIVESKEDVGDRLFGVPDVLDLINEGNPGYNLDFSIIDNFRHGYFIIQTDDYGYVAMIPIGLGTIGSVVFEEKFKNLQGDTKRKVYKGEKLGHFAYGGSTVLLLFEKGRLNSLTVRQGQQIGKMRK